MHQRNVPKFLAHVLSAIFCSLELLSFESIHRRLCTAGWHKTALSRESACVVYFRAKGFTWIPPVGEILVLVPRFDREFVVALQRHDFSAARMARDLKPTLFSTETCVSVNELLRE